MNQSEINSFIQAFHEMDTVQCIIFNNCSTGSLSEMSQSATVHNNSVSILAIKFNDLNVAECSQLWEACNDATISGKLNKKVNFKGCL